MGILDISLSAGMRNSLLSLKGTAAKIDKTQERLSTGKRVNSALDNPTNFFASQAHLNRAGDLNSRKDGMTEAIQNGEAANAGLKAITSLIESAKGIASAAHSANASDRASMANQFNIILDQIDTLAGDSGYRGTNLIKGDNLTVNFNENGSSNLTINGVDATSGALGISKTSQLQGNAIAGGNTFSLGLKSDGSVVAWGDNTLGETTVPAAAQSGVVSVAAGNIFSLALKNDGSVVAWGQNASGQTTVPASAQSGVTAIAAGDSHALALKNDGSVIAWGSNGFGETTIPAAAQTGVVSIAAAAYFSLALKSDGSVIAWGENNFGQTTVPVAAQSGVIAVAAAGADFSLALKSDGSVIAWGNNTFGATNVPVAAQSGVVAIATGGNYSLALKNDGSVVAWGLNNVGQTTVPAAALSGVVAIAAGAQHALALKSDGSVVAWGDNTNGGATVPLAAQSGVGLPNYSWTTDANITTSETQLETAMNTLRTNSAALSSTLSVIAVRQDFTKQMINTLQTGSDNLTLADMNEEGANMLMLQTQQNLGITSLSLASQASQSVMKLF